MTLQTIPENLGYGGAHLNRSVLREILVELQNKVTELETGQGGLLTQVGGLVSADAFRNTAWSAARLPLPILRLPASSPGTPFSVW